MSGMGEFGVVNVTPGSAVGRLGDAAAAAEATTALGSRDTPAAAEAAAAGAAQTPGETPEAKAAREAAERASAGETPEAKAAREATEKTAKDKADAITAAEKAVADAKTPEEKAAAEAKLKELKGEEKPGAPEKYEAFKMPEGVVIDEALLKEAEPLFRDLNLSQSQAQKLVDLQAREMKRASEAHVEQWNQLLDSRLTEAKADKEVGGLNWDKSVADARLFLKEFGTPALQDYINRSDAGSHVEIIRAFAKAGRALSDDKFVPAGGGAPAGQPKSLAERMFPNHKP